MVKAQPRQQYLFSHFGLKEGLISEELTCVQQDSKGYIWIGTNKGLQRYDGHKFLLFQKKQGDTGSIPSNNIYNLKTDHKNRLWIYFLENRIGYLDLSDLSFHEIPIRINNIPLRTNLGQIFIDNRGNISLLLPFDRFFTFNEINREFSEKNNLLNIPANWRPNHIMQDKQEHNYWISCDSGLVKYNPALKTTSYRHHNTDHDPVIAEFANLTSISISHLDNQNRFWVYAWPNEFLLYSFNVLTKKRTSHNTDLGKTTGGFYFEIHALFEQQDGTMWFMGLNIFSGLLPHESSMIAIPRNAPSDQGVRSDLIRNIFQDKEKNLWVSTNRGLYRFNPTAQLFTVINNVRYGKDSFYTSETTDIVQLKNGTIYTSSWGNGIFAYDDQFKPLHTNVVAQSIKTSEGMTWCILERPNGDIWRGNQDGYLYIYYAASKKTIRHRPPVFDKSTIRQMVQDRLGNIWLGTHRGLLVKWNAAGNTFEAVKKFSTIYRLMADRNGSIWVCTGHTGVYHIDPATNTVIATYQNDAPEGKKIAGLGSVDIVQYNDSLYVIVSSGLNILNVKTDSIRIVNTDNGLPSNSISNIIFDKSGYLWMSIENSLWKWNLQKGTFSEFTPNDGLPFSTYEMGSASMLADGRIAFGRGHDFIVFDPERINNIKLPSPKVEITGFILMNQPLPVDSLEKKKTVELPYDKNSVIIEFSTLTYLNTFATSYIMEGLDENWRQAKDENQAIYTYLPPGDYVFKVKSTNGEGGISPITTLAISITPPFWRTWWFYSLVALLITGLLYWMDRERMRRKEATQKIRSEIAGNLYEDINTALNNINVLSEIARIKADREPEQSKNYITEIHHKSHNMIIAMDDMLWSIDPANDTMAKTVERMKEFADALRNRHEVIINFQTDTNVTSLKPDMKIRHELLLIFKLVLRLLIEEPRARQTTIQLDYQKAQLEMNIFSPGIKLSENNNQVIKSIEEMRQRAQAIKALLELQSDEKGTAVFLAIKLV